ncbi:MAG: glutathione S-transferase family protein [Alphaproteobacteria bacterium]|nr:glutathione S-transferase family protein [Alphaproteobacteria bacterium]
MADAILYIGNKRYSSWSLRGWLPSMMAGFPFKEVVIPLDMPETRTSIRAVSASGRVPCLHHDGNVIWDSMAIAEYCAELAPDLWPVDRDARAHARVIAAEMHSGFQELRKAMFFNVGRRWPGHGRTAGALADITRIVELWETTRTRYGSGGAFLFGKSFTLADAFYAPIVCRFKTWEPELPADARAYVDAVWTQPLVARWVREGLAETWRSPKYEAPPG